MKGSRETVGPVRGRNRRKVPPLEKGHQEGIVAKKEMGGGRSKIHAAGRSEQGRRPKSKEGKTGRSPSRDKGVGSVGGRGGENKESRHISKVSSTAGKKV